MIKFVIILIVDILFYEYAPDVMSKPYMALVLFTAFFTIVSFNVNSEENLRRVYLRHSIFFAICYVIVFFQCNIDFVLGIIDNSNSYLWIDEKVVCKSLAFSNMVLTCLCIGNLSLHSDFNIEDFNVVDSPVCESYFNGKKYLAHFDLALLLIYIAIVPKDYFNNGYVRGVETGGVYMIIAYMQAGLIAVFSLYSIDYKSSGDSSWVKYFRYPLIVSFLYMFLVLVTGRRTEAIRGASLILITYIYCNGYNVNYKKTVIYGILSIAAFSIIGVLRSLSTGNIRESARILSESSSISPFTRELAGSVNTLHIAMSNYPSVYDYNYGETFLPSFFKIVPGLTDLWKNYVVGHSLESSDEIFTNIYFSGRSIWGVGSSIVADAYISFGVIGTCIIFFLFGRFIKYLEIKSFLTNTSPYIVALSFSSYSAFMFACRGTMATIFLCWTYSCILIYVFSKLNKS